MAITKVKFGLKSLEGLHSYILIPRKWWSLKAWVDARQVMGELYLLVAVAQIKQDEEDISGFGETF